MESNIAVTDCDSLIYTAFHPNKVLDEHGTPLRENNKFVYVEKTEEEIINSCDTLLHMILTRCKATSYIGFVKGNNTTHSRLKINPLYKANRGAEPPKHWNLCKSHLMANWDVIEVHNFEVDDYVNVTRLALKNAFIVAIDKDLLSLETKDKFHYNWKKNEWVEITRSEAEEKFWCDMISGQSGDNIPGLHGKGDAYFKKISSPIIFDKGIEFTPPLYNSVLMAYFDYYKDFSLALDEYYKTYKSLKILDEIEGFVPPKPIKYMKKDVEDGEENKFKLDF